MDSLPGHNRELFRDRPEQFAGLDAVLRSLLRAVYLFRDAALVDEKRFL